MALSEVQDTRNPPLERSWAFPFVIGKSFA